MRQDLILSKNDAPQMFNQIAKRYDFLNRLLSLGQDVHWRNQLSAIVPQQGSLKLLDLATGTADVIISLVNSHANISHAIGVDPASGMLDIGRQKVKKQNLDKRITLQEGDAQALPFGDNEFDVVTISFGIRNIPNLRLGLLEMFRVLKKDGTLIILEFSKPINPALRFGHWMYMNAVVPIVGFIFSGNFKAYQYLNETVDDFPYGERFIKILKQFGFVDVKAVPLMGGVATIYSARK